MTDAAVIRANYADWRPVKGRKVLQLVFEVPLEQQEEVLKILGAPLPDKTRWCAIALLNETESHPSSRSVAAKAAYKDKPIWAKAAQRAAILCGDAGFREWITARLINGGGWLPNGPTVDSSQAGQWLRDKLDIPSRAEIGTDERAYRAFLAIEADYKQSVGQMAEAR